LETNTTALKANVADRFRFFNWSLCDMLINPADTVFAELFALPSLGKYKISYAVTLRPYKYSGLRVWIQRTTDGKDISAALEGSARPIETTDASLQRYESTSAIFFYNNTDGVGLALTINNMSSNGTVLQVAGETFLKQTVVVERIDL